ncbi:hypothetical protein ABIB30_001137 [Pedobacter sp. UYP1]
MCRFHLIANYILEYNITFAIIKHLLHFKIIKLYEKTSSPACRMLALVM